MAKGILIASASAGTGHTRAAEAVSAALRQRDPGLRVEHVDVLELAPAWVRTAYRDGFELLAARAPGVWRELYHLTDGPGADSSHWSVFAHKLLFRAFERVVRSQQWDACVCTHFLPAQLMAGRAGTPPFSMVVTDFGLHRYWAQPGVGRYFVATEAIAADLRERVRRVRVDVSGIPVRPDLLESPTRHEAIARLGLTPGRPVVVVMGGGLGLGVTRLAGAAAAGAPNAQIVALCGRSAAAREALSDVPRLRAVGYVDDVRPYLAAADLIVTKPGGLTSSEALALGRPLVLAEPIPGHEEANRRILVDAGAAVAADSPTEVSEAVHALLADVSRRLTMSRAARRLGRPLAALNIARSMYRDHVAEAVA